MFEFTALAVFGHFCKYIFFRLSFQNVTLTKKVLFLMERGQPPPPSRICPLIMQVCFTCSLRKAGLFPNNLFYHTSRYRVSTKTFCIFFLFSKKNWLKYNLQCFFFSDKIINRLSMIRLMQRRNKTRWSVFLSPK